MLEDVEAGRPTEVELINGALVREAERAGVDAPLQTALYALIRGRGGVLLVKVCVVGCGAVGGLFAANLAQLDDVEVWAYDLDADHVAAINERGLRLSGAGEVVGQVRATTDPGELAGVRFRSRGDEVDAHRVRGRRRTPALEHASVASVQNGVGNEEAIAERLGGHSRHDVPGRSCRRARPRAVGREGRDDARPVRAEPGAGGKRSSASRMPARALGCRRRQWPTRAAPSGGS